MDPSFADPTTAAVRPYFMRSMDATVSGHKEITTQQNMAVTID